MTTLVTGASGFIGRHVAARLCAAGLAVRGTYRSIAPFELNGLEWRRLERVEDPGPWPGLLTGVVDVVHLAGLAHQVGRSGEGRWEEFRRTNVDGAAVVAKESRRAGIRRLVYISSIAASGTGSSSSTDYGRSKMAAERAIEEELEASGTDWCILRPPLVYGPGNPGNMARLFRLIESGFPMPFGSISNMRSFIFVENLADAIAAVLKFEGPVRASFEIGDGTDLSTPRLIETLADFSGKRARLIRVPRAILESAARVGDALGFLLGRSVPFDSYSMERLTESLTVDASPFAERFLWTPPVAPIRALEETCRAIRGRSHA